MPRVTPTLLERAEVVTTRVYTNPTESAAAAQTSTATKVPIGAIVGGIVAGVAVACIIGGLWWWCAGRREKQRDVSSTRYTERVLTIRLVTKLLLQNVPVSVPTLLLAGHQSHHPITMHPVKLA